MHEYQSFKLIKATRSGIAYNQDLDSNKHND